MSPPAPQINTFIKVSNRPVIDFVSKTFIIAGLILGLNRLPLLGVTKKVYTLPMCGFSLCFVAALFYVTFKNVCSNFADMVKACDSFRSIIYIFMAFLSRSKLQKFYLEIKKIDQDIGFKIKKVNYQKCIQNYVHITFTVIFLSVACYQFADIPKFYIFLIPMYINKLIHFLELNYYGHLFLIVNPRINIMSNYIKVSQFASASHRDTNLHNFKKLVKNYSKVDMKKILELYKRILSTYNFLYEAIKWQMLTSIVLTFINLLSISYYVMKFVIENTFNNNQLGFNISLLIVELVPLFAPCIYADQVCDEVLQLKDVLASTLHQKTLDKSNRSAAHALLTLIETYNLSFSLFHMFEINVSLPFKVFGLLLTYVIILLQFNKVVGT